MPELNKRINLGKSAKPQKRKAYRLCDLFWPDAGLAIERAQRIPGGEVGQEITGEIGDGLILSQAV
ncbi:MAG: hypothetical protein FWF33_06645 [Clostridiales bacterium]|nr:hypothetical protein [Clostridiales bacterium]